MKRFLFYGIFYAGILLMLSSCKKDNDENITYYDINFNPSALSAKIPAGLMQSADPYAKIVSEDITSMLDWSEFLNQLKLPADAEKISADDSRQTYQWIHNTGSLILAISLVFSKEGNEYQWKEKIQYGTGMANDFLTAKESKDKKSGSLDFNVFWFCGLDQLTEPCDALLKHYEWEFKDDGGIFYASTGVDPSSIPAQYIEYRLNLNADGTGSSMANAGLVYYNASWDNKGNGIYTLHDGDNVEMHEWTAGE
jgi:hypothetical protein